MADKATVDLDFLAQAAGNGFENMDAQDTAIPRLLVSQQMSKIVSDGTVPVGHFYNSTNGKDYGASLRVIPCSFQKAWVEWKPNQGGYVGTYPVGGIEGVTGDQYTGMMHGENTVIETWMYIVVLPDHLEDGLLLFSSTRGNVKYLKAWNTAMKYLRTPSGRAAPLFSSVWTMTLAKDQNKKGNTYYSCNENGKSSIKWDSWVTKDLFTEFVLPANSTSSNVLAIADATAESVLGTVQTLTQSLSTQGEGVWV